MGLNRKMRKIAVRQDNKRFYRVIPYFQQADGKIVEGSETYVLHTPSGDRRWVKIPKTASVAFAKAQEQRLTDFCQTDVIVATENIVFCREERLTSAEVEKLLKEAGDAGQI